MESCVCRKFRVESESEPITVSDSNYLFLMGRSYQCGVVNRIKSGSTDEYAREFSAQHLRIDFVLKGIGLTAVGIAINASRNKRCSSVLWVR